MFRSTTNFSSAFLENERRYFIVPDVGRSQTGPTLGLLSRSSRFVQRRTKNDEAGGKNKINFIIIFQGFFIFPSDHPLS